MHYTAVARSQFRVRRAEAKIPLRLGASICDVRCRWFLTKKANRRIGTFPYHKSDTLECKFYSFNPGRPFIALTITTVGFVSEGGTGVTRVKLFWLNFTSAAAFLHAVDPSSLSRGAVANALTLLD